MDNEQKGAVVEELLEKFSKHAAFYVTDAKGLTVSQINELRQMCYDKGVVYKVAKNTLIKKALEQIEGTNAEIYDYLKGPSSVFFTDTTNLPGKILADFRKKHDLPVLKAAYVDGEIFAGDDKIKELASLKSKDELVGEIIGLLQSPITNVLGSLQFGQNTIGGIVKTLSEREEA